MSNFDMIGAGVFILKYTAGKKLNSFKGSVYWHQGIISEY